MRGSPGGSGSGEPRAKSGVGGGGQHGRWAQVGGTSANSHGIRTWLYLHSGARSAPPPGRTWGAAVVLPERLEGFLLVRRQTMELFCWLNTLIALPTLLFLGCPACVPIYPLPPVLRVRICLLTQVHNTLTFFANDLLPHVRLDMIKTLYFFQSLRKKEEFKKPIQRDKKRHRNSTVFQGQSPLPNNVILACLFGGPTAVGREAETKRALSKKDMSSPCAVLCSIIILVIE